MRRSPIRKPSCSKFEPRVRGAQELRLSEEDKDQNNEVEGSFGDDLTTSDDIEVIPDEPSDQSETGSIFDLFEPPPEIDADRFGPIPVIPEGGDVVDEIDDEPMLMDPIDITDGSELGEPADNREPRSLGLFDSVPDDPNFVDRSGAEGLAAVASLPDHEELEPEFAEPEFADDEMDVASDEMDLATDVEAVYTEAIDAADAEYDDAGDEGDDTRGLSVDELLGPIEDADADAEDGNPEIDGEAGDIAELAEGDAVVGEGAAAYGDLPHWTEPPTGSVPTIGGGDDEWSDVTGPQWQGEGNLEGDDLTEVFADTQGVGFDESASIDDLENELADIPNPAGAPQRGGPRVSAPESDVEIDSGRNIPQAIAVGVIFAGLALFAFQMGAVATVALITVIAVLASAELYGAMRKVGLRPATLLGIVASAALPLAVYNRGEAAFMMVIALVVIFGALWYLVGAETHKPALNLGLTMLGVLWIGVLASFGALIVLLPDGISILLAAICVTVAYDTFAFAGGKAFGSRPFHSASPNKTWEGTIVGVVAAVVAGFVVGLLEISPFSGQLTNALLLGLVAGILAPIGDLTESMIKRDIGVKDMGSILPGHGGILDRLDGLLFVLPGVYYLARVLELV